MGWKINVLDSCDAQPEGSSPEISLALPEHVHDEKETDGDLKTDHSIRIETRVKPNDIFQTQTKSTDPVNEDVPQNDSTDPTTPKPDTTEPPTDISYISVETDEKAQETNATQDKPESPNNQEDLSMMFPAGRLPLEPEFANLPPRRPHQKRPIYMNKPIYVPIHRPQISYKKPFYRNPIRRGPIIRPIPHVHPTNSLALTQEPVLMLPPPKPYLNISSTTPITAHPTTTDIPKLRPAINTGFHPESVVIESGFKPIINKEFEKRISEDEEDSLEDPGVIRVPSEAQENSQTLTQTFEPMFIPSPLDHHSANIKKQNLSIKFFKRRYSMKKTPQNVMVIVKEARTIPRDEIDEEDGMVMAAERIESYYLPPDDRKIKPLAKSRKPSNIDIPPGSVVTFDGKTVSGSSLTAPVSLPSSFNPRSSKSEILRLTPQFGPFRGEKPPLNPKNVNVASINHETVNRDLNPPEAKPKSIRLSPVRLKRSPHHTPEHTEEQKREFGKKAKKVVLENKRTRVARSPHHTPEHTEEQKRDSTKKPKKDIFERSGRTIRSPHHTPEHTAEQKRESVKKSKKVVFIPEARSGRTIRSPHHTPEHTAEQKRESVKLAKKFRLPESDTRSERLARSPHHTPEHTEEQKRESNKKSKKVIFASETRSGRTIRSPHHTPEHTAEQKRESGKLAKKFRTPEFDTRSGRVARSPHHTAEHTQEQKRESAKKSKKVVFTPETRSGRTVRSPHHTPEHTAEQKRDSAKKSKKVILTPETETRSGRIVRSPHHTAEHTEEQNRKSSKKFKKFPALTDHKRSRVHRTKRHHTPEHTAEQMEQKEQNHDDHGHLAASKAICFQPMILALSCVLFMNLL